MTESRKNDEPQYVNLRMRAEGDRLQELRKIADRDFEGNISMAIRRAIREYVDRVVNEAKTERTA